MLTFEYVKALINADKDVPYRTCPFCKTPMVITRRQWFPHVTGCKCRPSGEVTLVRLTWIELREMLERHAKLSRGTS